ncbi:hypothetical protein FQR65_LT09300 [Abscondita terminalis]|nr:hypothetical protein FQR65_LT09300 [Abscondita terminalis]
MACTSKKTRALFVVFFCYINLGVTQIVNAQRNETRSRQTTEDFLCPENLGNGNYADPQTCRRFYQCVDGYPYLNRCPSGLFFDDISKLCTFKDEARCGPIVSTPAPVTEPAADLAEKCNPKECLLPECFCSKDGTSIPGGLDPTEVPQMILLTFDGAINLNNYHHYKKVFQGNTNPNGCEIKGTFFVAHEYSNYQMIQELASNAHEIATETISLQMGLQDKGYEEWVGEMIGMREILRHFSNISKNEVVGMRAPFLKPGRNTQFRVLEDFGYIYDSSIGAPVLPIPIWPYTLDSKIPHECKAGTCPTRSFPGIWEIPLNPHYVEDFEGGHCPYLDQCVLHNHDSDEVLEWLQEDFSRHYEQNRAPYMMAFHTNWFSIKALEGGLRKFLAWTQTLPDVYYVTISQALTWMTDPKPLRELNNFEAWGCTKKNNNLPPPPCQNPNKCALSFKPDNQNISDTRYLETCFECPNRYPWIGDAEGSGIEGQDSYVPESIRE